jgi:hypothetical protein
LDLTRAETPNEALIRKMHPDVWLGLAFKMFGCEFYEKTV